jgi:hypothetical protein
MKTSRTIIPRVIGLSVVCFFLHFAWEGNVFAQPKPVGSEFRMNTYIAGDQNHVRVAHLSEGQFVVIWRSYNQDGSGWGVYGQVFDSTGNKVGSEFRVSTYTTNDQDNPSVAALSGGGFVVIWCPYGQAGSFGYHGQVYNSMGNNVGTQFKVNTYNTNGTGGNAVAGLSGGGFAVIWESLNQDGSGWGVYGQVFNSAGNKVGSEFRVNTYTTADQGSPETAALSGGGFVVTWNSNGQDGSGLGVYGQVFNSTGNKVGSELRVNTYTTGDQDISSVAGLSEGGFVVAWDSNGQDGSGWGVYGQVFNSAGNKVGNDFRVNTYTTGDQYEPSVAPLPGDRFVVTWMSDLQDGSDWGVYGQVFDSSGKQIGNEFRVNTYTNGAQNFPSVAFLPEDGFVVTWTSDGQDGSSDGVYGQLFSSEDETEMPNKGKLVVDFGATWGLWHYDQEKSQPWTQLNAVDPGLMTAVDIDNDGQDELVVSFVGYGLYTYKPQSKTWLRINTVTPEAMIRHGNGVACDFGAAHGLWLWDQTGGWKQINSVDPDKMISTDIDGDGKDELIVSFVVYGLYIYDEATRWTGITNAIPQAMIGMN